MSLNFLHCADLHLGRSQFNSEERFEDFGRAFGQIVEYALENEIDFLLICGDLFDRRNINAQTLIQATYHMKRLKDNSIPVIAIEGNHDRAFRRDRVSWMRYLAEENLIILLKPQYNEGRLDLKPWEENSKTGSAVEINGVRIYGLGYPGAMTGRRLMELAQILPDKRGQFTLVMLHAGIRRMMGSEIGALEEEEIEALRGKVDYLALGHLHRRYEIADWIFNPGAPECVDVDEATYEKGFYHVKVDESGFQADFIPSRRRDVYLDEIDVTGAPDPDSTIEMILSNIDWSRLSSMDRPIVRVTIVGEVKFNAMDIDSEEIKAGIMRNKDCLVVEVINNANLISGPSQVPGLSSREEVERQVLRGLIEESGYAEWADELVEAALDLRSMTQSRSDPSDIADYIKKLSARIHRAFR
ncbi:TPA: exonuclease SbcCD subunit D [Candidatus Poribacteria bacterium]|nr:exonuclease SbcCD subunit D [Candidatus Poribacteria bacterium]